MAVLVGIASWSLMAPSITEPAVAFKRPDGTNKWWTDEEEKILVNRLLRDDPTKGDLNNRTAVTLRGLWEALTHRDLWPIFFVSADEFRCQRETDLFEAWHFCMDSISAYCKLLIVDPT